MISLDRLDPKELTALRFADSDSFVRATEVFVVNNVRLEPIGNYTLVVHRADVEWLDKKKIAFSQSPVRDATRNGHDLPPR